MRLRIGKAAREVYTSTLNVSPWISLFTLYSFYARPAIFLYFILLLILVHLELVNMRDAGPTHDEFSAPQHIHNTQHQHIPPRTGTAIVIRSAAGDDRSPKVTHRARSGCVHSETLPPRRSTSTDKVRVRVAGGPKSIASVIQGQRRRSGRPCHAQNSMATVVSGLPFANKIIGCDIGCERAFAVNGA